MTFAAGSRGIYGWGRSGGSGCRRGGTFALIFAYDLAFVFAFAVSLPSVVTLVASAPAPVRGFSFSFTFVQIRVRWVEVPYVWTPEERPGAGGRRGVVPGAPTGSMPGAGFQGGGRSPGSRVGRTESGSRRGVLLRGVGSEVVLGTSGVR